MRVVADSHVLIFYLFTPDRLSEPALEALGEAEGGMGIGMGIVVSAATLGDLWYASHKSGPNSLAAGAFESLRRSVLDPAPQAALRCEIEQGQRGTRDSFCRGRCGERQCSMVLHVGRRSRSSDLGSSIPRFAHWSTTSVARSAA